MDTDNRRQLSVNAKIQVGICRRKGIIFRLLTLRDMAALIVKDKMRAANENLLFSTILEIPCAATYCTWEWYSSCVKPRRFASSTTAFAME